MSVSGSSQNKLMQELQAVLDDGPNFQKRLSQLVGERLAIEQAKADLHLAMQAKDAYDDAARKQAEATAMLADATRVSQERISASTSDAEKTRKEANDNYAKLSDEAQAILSDARAKASAMLSDAQDRVVRMTSDLQSAQDAIQSKLVEVTRKTNEVDAKLAAIEEREKAAELAKTAANEKLRRLMAAMEA